VATGRLLRTLGDRTTWDMNRVAFSPDGRLLAAPSSRRKVIVLWDVKTGKEVRSMAGTGSPFRGSCPAFSPDGRRLAAHEDHLVRVWEVATGKELLPPDAHRQAPSFVALLKDGTGVTGGDDGTVRLWDSATGRQRRKIGVADMWVRAVAVSPDGRRLATSELGERQAVRLWDLRTGRPLYRLEGHGRYGGRRALAFSPDGKRLASWGDDMYLRLWDVAKGKATAEHEVRPDGRPFPGEDENEGDRRMRAMSLGAGAFAPDASFLVVAERGFFVFDLKGAKQKLKFPNEGGHVIGLAVSPDGKHLLASTWGRSRLIKLTDGGMRITTDDPLACLYDLATGKVVRSIPLPKERIGAVAFAPDGKTFAVGLEGRIRLYTTTGAARGVIEKVPGEVRALAFSPDGKRLIAGLSDTTAVVWSVPGK
jgi:WD40 repeat protein